LSNEDALTLCGRRFARGWGFGLRFLRFYGCTAQGDERDIQQYRRMQYELAATKTGSNHGNPPEGAPRLLRAPAHT
jgi:hypothetical protein